MDYAKRATKKGASYAEVIQSKGIATTITIDNKKVKDLSLGEGNRYAVRLLYKGAWGLAHSTKPEFSKLTTKALKNAKLLKQKTRAAKHEPVRQLIPADQVDDPRDVSIEEKKALLLKLDKRTKFKKIKALNLTYGDRFSEYTFQNSEGSSITRKSTTVGLFSTAYAKQGNRMEKYLSILRKRAGYELMLDAQKTVNESMQKAEAMLKAKHAKGGLFPTVIDQDIAGVFAHEAVGHACEADAILTGSSVLINKLGKQIGGTKLTIIDDGNIKEWGYTPVDSEGVKSQHTVLIKQGILENYMHNRETAAEMRAQLTGNGRSQDPTMRVIPRMTNTVIAKGDSNFEEMIQSIKKGYYLKGSSGGQVDPAGGDFLFNAKEGYYVEKGKIKHMIKDVSLLGSILETLHNIKQIAKDTGYDTGYCGKAGQAVPVSCGAPHVLLDKAKIGGAK